MNSKEPTGDGRTDEHADGDRSVEHGDGSGAIFNPKPAREVQNHSRKEAGFRSAKEEARCIKLVCSVDERRENRDESPGDHDVCDPFASAPALNEDGSRNFEEDIRQEENAST